MCNVTMELSWCWHLVAKICVCCLIGVRRHRHCGKLSIQSFLMFTRQHTRVCVLIGDQCSLLWTCVCLWMICVVHFHCPQVITAVFINCIYSTRLTWWCPLVWLPDVCSSAELRGTAILLFLCWDCFQLDRSMQDAEQCDHNFYPQSVNACCDYSASGLWWRHIVNVNETIKIKLLLSTGPQRGFKLAMALRLVAWCGNASLISTISSI